jgi:hypothetical protein
LSNTILNSKKVVLLGNAGSGKSIELQQTAKYFLQPDTPFVPIYKRFNSYVNEDIDSFLPEDWDSVNPAILAIFLDGLDEVQPQHFNTAVRKLIDFSEKNPAIRIIVSCRTNFYELPNTSFSGTLPGFDVYLLNDPSLVEIKQYVVSNFHFPWMEFILNVHSNLFLDILQKPFFLDILIKHYEKNGDLRGGRLKIIEEFIFSMIAIDKEHFNNFDEINSSKKDVTTLLERVAFVMEMMGKNLISNDELEELLTRVQINEIRRFSLFSKNPEKNTWMFVHNNIQEFLAAQVLSRQSFDQLARTVSFPPNFERIRPTWVNTISFLVSTSSPDISTKLIDWIVSKDYEIIVKFEPERIADSIRKKIFKTIFNFYKEKNIWLSSNKFTITELARFANFPETLDFLLGEIQDPNNSRIIILNAINVLEGVDLANYSTATPDLVKKVLLEQLDKNETDHYFIYQVLYALGNLDLTNAEDIRTLADRYSNNINQYIRAGLYRLINKSGRAEEYVSLFLQGLNLHDLEQVTGKRDDVNLMDEGFHRDEGLKSVKSPEALRKILDYLKQPDDRRRLNSYDSKEVVDAVITNAFTAYETDPTLYGDLLDLFLDAGKHYDEVFANILLPFFKQNQKDWDVFKSIWESNQAGTNGKEMLLNLLLDERITHLFLEEYKHRNFSNDDAVQLHQLLLYKSISPQDKPGLIDHFEQKVLEISSLKLHRPDYRDWASINKKKTQESFELLLDKALLLKEIHRIFSKLAKSALEDNDLWHPLKISYNDPDYFVDSAVDILRQFTKGNRSITYVQIETWINSDHFSGYQIERIYRSLHGNLGKTISVNRSHEEFINTWCIRTASHVDISKAIRYGNNGFLSVNQSIVKLWFFVRKFKFTLPEEKLLDFTLFYDFEKQNDPDQAWTINELESLVSKEEIESRIIRNISSGITVDYVWLSNATYALKHFLKKAYPYILDDLQKTVIRESYRRQIVELYFINTGDRAALKRIISGIAKDELRWRIIQLLIPNEYERELLISYMHSIIKNKEESIDDKLTAANHLLQLDDLEGLRFIANHIVSSNDPNMDFHRHLRNISQLKRTDSVPILIELLELAKGEEFQTDRFNRLEQFILNGLHSIGITSDTSFEAVKKAINDFIDRNKTNYPHVEFFHFNIAKIEEQLYMTQSQSPTIKESLAIYNSLIDK